MIYLDKKMNLFTIGFTKKTAEAFFTILVENEVDLLIDIRLNPNSQLAGFSKQENLPYFLKNLIQCEYQYQPLLAPTKELLSEYRKEKDWTVYERNYKSLLAERKIPEPLDKEMYASRRSCLLCSEHSADFCHRRLAAEFLQHYWKEISLHHL